jgi:hypothetical protein
MENYRKFNFSISLIFEIIFCPSRFYLKIIKSEDKNHKISNPVIFSEHYNFTHLSIVYEKSLLHLYFKHFPLSVFSLPGKILKPSISQ